jgi:hypothetical protein
VRPAQQVLQELLVQLVRLGPQARQDRRGQPEQQDPLVQLVQLAQLVLVDLSGIGIRELVPRQQTRLPAKRTVITPFVLRMMRYLNVCRAPG